MSDRRVRRLVWSLSTCGAFLALGMLWAGPGCVDLSPLFPLPSPPPGERPLPHLTICNGQDAENFDLYLESDPAALSADAAYSFLKDLAERAQVPLRHLL